MRIRPATPEDAHAACDVVRRSIQELCAEDHAGDAAALDDWLANKTPENFAEWASRAHQTMLVAVDPPRDGGAETVLGVGMATPGSGEILLNYVAPEARFRGVSRALLTQMEALCRDAGADVVRLESTKTARAFYAGAGYGPDPCGSSRAQCLALRKPKLD